MKGVIISPERARGIYSKIQKKMAAQGYRGVISEREVRTEVYLANGQTEYLLSLKESDPKLSAANTERKMKDQDAHVFFGVGMFLAKEVVAGPYGNEKLHTFANVTEFADEVGGFQNAHLNAVYGGDISLKVGDSTYLDKFAVADTEVIRTTQQTGSVRSEKLPGDGFLDLTPQFTLRGFENNELKFNLRNNNAALKIQYTATNKVKLVFRFRTFVITGAGGTANYNLNFAD